MRSIKKEKKIAHLHPNITNCCSFVAKSKRLSNLCGYQLTGLRVAVAGVVVTLTGATPGAAEVEEA